MFRTDQTTAVTSLPVPAAAGTPGYFTGGNPATGQAATILDADWLNMVQEELCNLVVAAGLTLSKTTYSQILAAIHVLGSRATVLADVGSANAYAAENPTPMPILPETSGVVQVVQIAHANTGASTYAPDGLASAPIVTLGGAQLRGGELATDGVARLVSFISPLVNGGALCWVLIECLGVQRPLGNFQVLKDAITTNVTLTAADVGSSFQFIGSASRTATAPVSSTCTSGDSLVFTNQSTVPQTVARQGTTDTFVVGNTYGLTSITIPPGGTLALAAQPNANAWVSVGGSACLPYDSLFGSQLASVGYQKLPSGLIIQWGATTCSTSGYVGVTFPIAFPNAFLQATATATGSGSASLSPQYNTGTKTGMQLAALTSSNAYSNALVSWIAIGF
ncbi:hypothetical protein H0X90_21855 [Burkholderia sp. 9775_39]|uniref:gp53-like domain-containing protein n=1 Tax=unclassified Burkholderia TaxID=2613784 RepID=UPI0018C36992|nr:MULTISPECIES: hypothetical protein [unclassified Burkholderia]MBG0879439.1 hypothetical protein [Burkholderia sp. 9775_39]MBG0884580.1 hypothetical protein [Burkholderia sp. 9773_38]